MKSFIKKNKKSLLIALFAILLLVSPFHFINQVDAQGVPVTCEPPKVPNGNGLCVDPENPDDVATPGSVVNSTAPNPIAAALQWALGASVILIFGQIGVFLLTFSAMVLGLAGATFNFALTWTVVDMAQYINDLQGAIDVGWGLFRDVVNMFLIFILLYVSIRMILGGGGLNVQKTIRNVIIVALFINFSMLITKVIIDASNILAVGIYDNIMNSEHIQGYGAINAGEEEEDGGITSFIVENTGLSGALMRPIILTMIFDPDVTKKESLAGSLFNPTNMGNLANSAIRTTAFDPSQIVIVGIVGSVMMLITSFVFFASAIMFVTRLGVLIMLMVVSPLAFASMAFPGLDKNFDKWLQMLIKNSFFAPIFLFLIYFVAFFMNDPAFISTTQKFGIILNFILAIVMMLTTLLVANQMGVVGGKFAKEWAGKLSFGMAGYLGRATIGRRAYTMTQDKDLLDRAARGDKRARLQLKIAGTAASSSFDLRKAPGFGGLGKQFGDFGSVDKNAAGGYAKVREEKIKAEVKYAKDTFGKVGTDEEKAARLDAYAESLERPNLLQKLLAYNGVTKFEFEQAQARELTEAKEEIKKLERDDPEYERKKRELDERISVLEKRKKPKYRSDVTGFVSDTEAADKVREDTKKEKEKKEREAKKKKLKENKQELGQLNNKLKELKERAATQQKLQMNPADPLPPDNPIMVEMKDTEAKINKLKEDVEVGEAEERKDALKAVVSEETSDFAKKSDIPKKEGE